MTTEPVPWSVYGQYLASRPSFTFDPLFHAGCYYVQEASSMFLEQALQQTTDTGKPLRILDLSAAPGGKSTHIQSLIHQHSLLVSNEVIRSRAGILRDNLVKWGCSNVMVTQNDPRDFSRLKNYFDIVVVDAPCSGSGLFRREPDAMDHWSEANVQLCAQRQQRIIADVWPALKDDGVLIYSTCSYSREEDEEILDWIIDALGARGLELRIDPSWGIETVSTRRDGMGYRFWPHRVKGEGFFIACVRKNGGEQAARDKVKSSLQKIVKNERQLLQQWIDTTGWEFVKHDNTVYAWPAELAADFHLLLSMLRVVYSGTIIGELIKEKLVPHHALAMSAHITSRMGAIDVEREAAIAYLQKKDIHTTINEKGWKQVKYQGFSLGWVNVLTNRINNYYPKELRILKDI